MTLVEARCVALLATHRAEAAASNPLAPAIVVEILVHDARIALAEYRKAIDIARG